MVKDAGDVADVAIGADEGGGAYVYSTYVELVDIDVSIDTTLPNSTIVGFAHTKIAKPAAGTATVKVDLNGGSEITRSMVFAGHGDMIIPFVYKPGSGSHTINVSGKTTGEEAFYGSPYILIIRYGAK